MEEDVKQSWGQDPILNGNQYSYKFSTKFHSSSLILTLKPNETNINRTLKNGQLVISSLQDWLLN